MVRNNHWVILIVISSVIAFSYGLQCYNCYTVQNDDSCLTSETHSATIDCPNGTCIIYRQDLTESPGIQSTFRRECSRQRPIIYDQALKNQLYINYYRSCQTDLCNIGDGLKSYIDTGEGGGGSRDEDFIWIGSHNSEPKNISFGFTLLILSLTFHSFANFL